VRARPVFLALGFEGLVFTFSEIRSGFVALVLEDQAEVIPDQWYSEAFEELQAQGHLDTASGRTMGGDAYGLELRGRSLPRLLPLCSKRIFFRKGKAPRNAGLWSAFYMVGREGFEPSTLGLRVPCSTN
jgi:hypothetical protein